MKVEFTPSKYQKDIFEWIQKGSGNSVVEAVAGSGKTTTIERSLYYMKGKILFCAFNKHIAQELSNRVPNYVAVSTIHSMGLLTIRNAIGDVNVNADKLRRIVENVVGDDSHDTLQMRRAIETTARLAKLTMANIDNPDEISRIIDRYDVDCNGEYDEVVETVPEVIKASLEDRFTVDFDDMIYFPCRLDLNPKRYDWVVVDETQDLNAAQQILIQKACAGRLIAVGDRRQAIYGFSGADTQSIPNMIIRFQASVLPLSICYRCPKSHIRLAQEIVPQIEPKDGAPEGIIETIRRDEMIHRIVKSTDNRGWLVICRLNRPLTELAMELVRHKVKAVIRGQDIGSGLINLIDKMRANDLASLFTKLNRYKEKQVESLLRRGKQVQARNLEDRIEAIQVLAGEVSTVEELCSMIREIFSDDSKQAIVLSTVHKAKGLQADRVCIYRPDLMPLRWATEDWEIEQEKNLKYVALTRSKEELYMVSA